MGPALFDYNMRLIQLSVIQLSGMPCNMISCFEIVETFLKANLISFYRKKVAGK